ncbi:hypothetical protein [Croceimicrobium hydrocarbonivorans]|uniref:Glycosyltransferase RgtA/B/C/D-like domain-containing protein n=1 Tax=Croceimicrobium hydrocarbonivorans TaxID=2761580 RepID=A0A7H0VIP4_9FLAO|nr:hypothetical protein [Croceimicrobium hydrocarbonivorans]QNR25592.1 hypothetical protein H4K34_07045 [Croceimicrobium hydrocarbonivorans]
MKPRIQTFFLVLAGILFFALFFFHYSLWYFEELNSDHAIHILMAERFDWAKDWYYWGQNRLGSFIPMMGSLLISLGVDSFTALGLVQVLILTATSFMLFRLSNFSFWSLGLCAVLLFPIYPFWMQVSLGHPYLGQFFFLILSLSLFYSSKLQDSWKSFLVPFIAFLAIWSSEMSLAFYLALALIEYKHIWKLFLKGWYYLLSGAGLGLVLVLVAKNQAVKIKDYQTFLAPWSKVWESFSQQMKSLWDLFFFEDNKPFNTYLLYGVLLVLLFTLIRRFRGKQGFSAITKIFFLTAIFSLVLIHLSNWNAAMGMPLRYHTMPYFFFTSALVFGAKDQFGNSWEQFFIVALISMPIMNASLRFNLEFETGAQGRIRRSGAEEVIAEVLAQSDIEHFTVIGSYWNTHLLDALSPKVLAITREGDHLRDGRMMEEALHEEYFLIIANDWLDHFPKQIEQRGIRLHKLELEGNSREVRYALYQRIPELQLLP